MEKQFKYEGRDKHKIHVYKWTPPEEAVGVIQIVHGMAEHAARYRRFAEFLNQKGFIVYADDHRGHGKTVEDISELGYIGEDGFYGMVEDEKILTDIIKKEHKDLPVIVFGHSMGSFVSQEYITRYGNEIDGVVLSGTAGKFGPDVKGGAFLAGIQMKFIGDKAPAKLLDKMSFGSYNNKVEKRRTKFDWLSRDDKEVDKYNEDKYCGTLFPVRFFYEFFKGISKLHDSSKLESIPKKLPVYIFAGDKDPVGSYGKSIENLNNMYKELGIENLSMKLYSGGRHEMLNEVNRQEVYEDVYNWVKGII